MHFSDPCIHLYYLILHKQVLRYYYFRIWKKLLHCCACCHFNRCQAIQYFSG